MAEMTIYPEEIKTTFWDDLASEFSGTRYLGTQQSESKSGLTLVRCGYSSAQVNHEMTLCHD